MQTHEDAGFDGLHWANMRHKAARTQAHVSSIERALLNLTYEWVPAVQHPLRRSGVVKRTE
ncbi:hypothetical protein E4U21_007250 [Claviceps maximensis]|nr:hypothetical protein E4U21_007250 [Claviceps maximensis]